MKSNRTIVRAEQLLSHRTKGTLTICVGPGVSLAAGMPTAQQLARELVTEWAFPALSTKDVESFLEQADLPSVLELVAERLGRERFASFVQRRLQSSMSSPTALLSSLAGLPANVLITTNFDNVLETALQSAGKPFSRIVADDDISTAERHVVNLVKLFGTIDEPQSLVFSLNRYGDPASNRSLLDGYVRTVLASSLTLFVGFGLQGGLLDQLFERYGGQTERIDWIVLSGPDPNALAVALWERRGVRLLPSEFEDLPQLLNAIGTVFRERPPAPQPRGGRQRLLIAGDAEALPLMRTVAESAVEHGLEPIRLTESVFDVDAPAFQTVYDLARSVSAAVVVLPADHWLSDASSRASRDNVFFELGLLAGVLGRENVLVLVPPTSRLPVDLSGVSFAVVSVENRDSLAHAVRSWLVQRPSEDSHRLRPAPSPTI